VGELLFAESSPPHQSASRDRWRLFIALSLPAAAREAMWEHLAPYRDRHRSVRWLPAGTWHVTMLFLGAVPVERVAEVIGLADRVAAGSSLFSLTVKGGGGRERHGEAVAWLTVREGAGRVIELAGSLWAACPEGLTAGAPPRRTMAAHLTVARKADRAVIHDLVAERWGRLEAAWPVDRLALLRSHLGPSGASYETLHEATLYAPG
jgi:2'-5' RNA ligase